MRTIATFAFHLVLVAAFQFSPVSTSDVLAQTYVSSVPAASQSYYCQKCGTYHTRPINSVQNAYPSQGSYASSTNVSTNVTSHGGRYSSYRPAVSYSGGATQNVLSMLNSQRARMGIASLQYDPQLQAVAEQRARTMASTGMKNHPPGSFAPGRYEGVGWSSSFSPSGVSACYTSDTRMRYAGAAMATGRDGVYFAVVYR